MKVNYNEYLTKSVKDIKNINLYKTSNISFLNNQKISSPVLKPNKTIKKYINERLNSIKKINMNKKEEFLINYAKQNYKNQQNSKKNKLIIYPIQNNIKKHIVVIKKKKNKEKKFEEEIIKDNDYNRYNNNDNSIDKTFNIISNKNKNESNKESKNSISTSAGLSFYSNENKKNYKYSDSDRIRYNNYYNNIHKYNVDSLSIKKNSFINDFDSNKFFLEESNYNKDIINNFNYESNDDNSENKILLKYDDNSLLTFGNSFSYSNSQRSKSTHNLLINGDNDNINNNEKKSCKNLFSNYNINNNIYVNKLKEENETLKKELKESNQQINILMYQIKELKQNKKYNYKTNKICSPNIWNKNMKYLLMEKEIYNNINSLDKNELNEKMRFNKNILKDINNTINDKINLKKGKKKIIIKRKFNLKEKINQNKKRENNYYYPFNKHSEKIIEIISKLQIE